MKTRIIVYGLLVVVITGTAYYSVIKEKMPTGRGTGMGVSYSYDGYGNIQTGRVRQQFNKSLSELKMQKGKVRGIRTSDLSDDYRVDFEHKEERYVSYGIYPDSKVIPLVFLAYQTKSECMIGLDGGTIVYIMLDQGYQDQTTLMMRKLEEMNNATQIIRNYMHYIWYYVYSIYRRIR